MSEQVEEGQDTEFAIIINGQLAVVPHREVSYAEVTFHGPVLAGDELRLVSSPGQVWLMHDDEVRVSGEFT